MYRNKTVGWAVQKSNWKTRAPGLVFGFILAMWALSDEPLLGGGPGFGLAQGVVFTAGLITMALTFLWPKAVPGVITIVLSFGVALVLAELIIGGAYAPRYTTAFDYDPELHYKLIPGAEREYQHTEINGGDRFSYHVNDQGFRGPALKKATAGLRRLVVYGDSFIQGEYSRHEDTFVHQLGKALQERLPGELEAVNAGVAGYGPDQALLKMRLELDLLKPDLVVMAIYSGNDFGDLVRNKLFRIDADENLIDNDFLFREHTVERLAQSKHDPIIRKMLREQYRRLTGADQRAPESPEQRIARFLKQHQTEYRGFVEDNNNLVGDLREDPYTADISILGLAEPSAAYKIRMMGAVLREIQHELSKRDIPALLLVIPHPIDVMGGKHDSGHIEKTLYPNYVPSRLTDAVVTLGEQAGFTVVNLFSYFAANDPASLYFRGGDDHWNAQGQAFAAQIVADFAQDQGLLKD